MVPLFLETPILGEVPPKPSGVGLANGIPKTPKHVSCHPGGYNRNLGREITPRCI